MSTVHFIFFIFNTAQSRIIETAAIYYMLFCMGRLGGNMLDFKARCCGVRLLAGDRKKIKNSDKHYSVTDLRLYSSSASVLICVVFGCYWFFVVALWN